MFYLPIIIIIPVDITKTKVIKNKTMFNNDIVEVKLSNTSVIESNFNKEEMIEQKLRKKYHTSNSIITGKFISIIVIIIKTPNVLFIIKKLLITDETASLTLLPTTGINVPDINLIPFKAKLSDEDANML